MSKKPKPRPAPWSHDEDNLIVDDYLAMLAAHQRGEKVNKAATRRALLAKLNNRSEGSVELKRMNVSAVLESFGKPYLPGYKPAYNYQQQLEMVVAQKFAIKNS